MRIMRSVAAIAIGLGFMAATVRVGTLVASALIGGGELAAGKPSGTPMAAYLFVNLVICGIGGILGGWLAARIASCAPYGHAAVMAAIVAGLSITIPSDAPAPARPEWYPSVLGLVAVLGVLLGGKLRAAAASGAGPVVA
jgi:hypothetical protein